MAKKYTHVIVTDIDRNPMAWDGEQLCYCTDERWEDNHHFAKSYTVKRAKQLIAKSIEFRKNAGFSETQYLLMPFKP